MLAANAKIIYATQSVCSICGKPVDKSLKAPHPLSKTVDHVIPVSRGGHPSAIENLALAHRECNQRKSDKLNYRENAKNRDKNEGNRTKTTHDWRVF